MILVFGSINLDLIFQVPTLPRAGETIIGSAYAMAPGGKGANQALAAARDGARVALIGAVGRDLFAEPALSLLRAEAVDLSAVRQVDRATGCAAVCVGADGENQIVVAAGANGTAAASQVPDALLGPEVTLVMQMEVPPSESARLAARAKAKGGRVVLNFAPALDLPPEFAGCLDILIANETEAARLGTDKASFARHQSVTLVETRGAAGAAAFTASGELLRVPALPISPVDTTGAGDSFVGVLAAALDRAVPLPLALRRASAAAALACGARSAQPSMPRTAAIDAALARLPVT